MLKERHTMPAGFTRSEFLIQGPQGPKNGRSCKRCHIGLWYHWVCITSPIGKGFYHHRLHFKGKAAILNCWKDPNFVVKKINKIHTLKLVLRGKNKLKFHSLFPWHFPGLP